MKNKTHKVVWSYDMDNFQNLTLIDIIKMFKDKLEELTEKHKECSDFSVGSMDDEFLYIYGWKTTL